MIGSDMSERWSGTYLKASASRLKASLSRLATARGYLPVLEVERVAYPLADGPTLSSLYKQRLGMTLDPVFVAPLQGGWCRLFGLEQVDSSRPRLLFPSELVMMLNCDAFECGFAEDVSWWYVYYEQGLPADRFDSNPVETIRSVTGLFPTDPNDPRSAYLAYSQLRPVDLTALPTPILDLFAPSPARLRPILNPVAEIDLGPLFHVSDPETGIRLLSRAICLPEIGQFGSLDLFDELSNTSRPPTPRVSALLEAGLSLTIYRHPNPIPWPNALGSAAG
jgi:hypothetical protein